MTISPPLIPDHGPFNELANRFARELSSAFGYSLPEAEEHIRRFYIEYEKSIPERRRFLEEKGVKTEPMSAEEVFWHDDSALVLQIGYQLAGGDVSGVAFLDWRKRCWDALKRGERVPAPLT